MGRPKGSKNRLPTKPRWFSKICKNCNEEFFGASSEKCCSIKCVLLSRMSVIGGCWICQGKPTSQGYIHFHFRHHQYLAHRLSYELSVGTIPVEKLVCHSCDTPACVNPKHLFLGTIQDNIDDRNKKLRQAWGERHASAKLDANQVRRIRVDERELDVIASAYSISQFTVRDIKARRTWRHLDMGG